MHIIDSRDGFDLGRNGRYSAGQYLCEDSIAGTLLNWMPSGIRLATVDQSDFPKFDETKDWNGKSILILRSGALGDLVLMGPCFREIQRRWPTCKIGVSCMNQFAEVVFLMDGLHFVSFPPDLRVVKQYDAVCIMERACVDNKEENLRHMTDVFASYIGLSHIEDKKPRLTVSKTMRENALARFPIKPGLPRLAIQNEASGRLRTYPDPYMSTILRELHYKKGWDIYILGEPGSQRMASQERLTIGPSLNLSIRESIALLSTCHLALAPDSFIVHAAAGLDVPVLALYAAFWGKMRTEYSPSVTVWQAEGDCAPCYFHDRPDRPANPAGPCSITNRCEVLVSIQPLKIVAKLERMWEKITSPAG